MKREKESEGAKATCLEKKRETARIKRKEETPMEKEVQHRKAQKKRETIIQQKIVKQKDSLKMSNNGLSQVLFINLLNSQVKKIGKSLNHR